MLFSPVTLSRSFDVSPQQNIRVDSMHLANVFSYKVYKLPARPRQASEFILGAERVVRARHGARIINNTRAEKPTSCSRTMTNYGAGAPPSRRLGVT